MALNDLNLNNSENPIETPSDENQVGSFVFRFAIRPVIISVLLKWKWILLVFGISIIIFWVMFYYIGNYSRTAWTSSAKVFHQTRSEKIPTFYKPIGTNAVVQFMMSHAVFGRVSARLEDSKNVFDRGMLSNVNISTGKDKENLIQISASASTPQTAAAIANAVAEEGVSEYIRRQNNSIKIMIDERVRQKEIIAREVATLNDSKKVFHSSVSGLSPDIELAKMREEISALILKQSEARIRLNEVNIRIDEVVKALKVTPKDIEFETTVDNTKAIGIDGKRAELEKLLERYTEDNPKVKIARQEIEQLETKMQLNKDTIASKVTYRRNSVHGELELQLMTLNLDKTTIISTNAKYEVEIETKRLYISKLLEQNAQYQEIVRRENMLLDKQSRLDDSINDLEFLISSAVPDVYVLETASVPSRSNLRKSQIKVALLSFIVTGIFVFALAAVRIAKMRIMDATEFKIALGIDNLGEIPNPSMVSRLVSVSSIQKFYHNLITADNNAKTFTLVEFGDSKTNQMIFDELLSICAMQGSKTFTIKCLPVDESNDEIFKADEADEIALNLLSVQKQFDSGFFRYNNNYSLDVAELDLFKFDLNTLSQNYDKIILHIAGGEQNRQTIAQIANLTEYVIISATFNSSNKLELAQEIGLIKGMSDVKIGGVLTDVSKPYFKE